MTSAFGEGPVCLLRDLLRPSLDPIPFRLDRLASTQEADGTLLDHSLFLYGASLSNPNLHAHYDLPLAVVGGDRRMQAGGRHLVFPPETPMTNLLLSLLDKVGVPADTLGDSTGRLDIEPLAEV